MKWGTNRQRDINPDPIIPALSRPPPDFHIHSHDLNPKETPVPRGSKASKGVHTFLITIYQGYTTYNYEFLRVPAITLDGEEDGERRAAE